MPTLRGDIKVFIVQSLACYETPTQVVESVKEGFGITLARSHIQQYDPTKRAGKDLGKRFVEIFESTRKVFLEDISKIPIANQSFRLRALQRSYDWFVAKNNYIAANQVLAHSAKEAGNFYANNTKPADNADHQLRALYKQISGSSISVVHDADIIDGTDFEDEIFKKEVSQSD